MRTSPNKTWQAQAKKLVPASVKKAIITAVNTTNSSVDVYIVGNNQTVIRNIPVASSIDITKVNLGDRCRVDMFDEKNPNDMVVAYTYAKPQVKKFSSGVFNVSHSGSTIPHGLGNVPDVISILVNASGAIYQTSPADNTNLYLQYDSAIGTLSVNWYVIKF